MAANNFISPGFFKDFLFHKFPSLIQEKDKENYVDANNEGLLQRILQIFGGYLDDYSIVYLNNLISLRDPLYSGPDGFSRYLSYEVGNPPDPIMDITTYRKLLRYIMGILKVKGSVLSYERFFAIFGYSVKIVWDNLSVNYDMGQYDITPYDSQSSSSGVNILAYKLEINDLNPAAPNAPTQETVASFFRAVKQFLEPINVNLTGITYMGVGDENIQWPIAVVTDVMMINRKVLISNLS